jgi:hypothetical protein
MLMGSGRTRDQWTTVVNNMGGRGAKATEPELVQILSYLSTNLGPDYTPGGAVAGQPAGVLPARPKHGAAGRGPGPLGHLAHFLHQRVYYTLRSGPELRIQNVLTGDPKAGADCFNGKCNSCHSVTGDLARIGARYDPPTLQMKLLFPRTVAFGRGRLALDRDRADCQAAPRFRRALSDHDRNRTPLRRSLFCDPPRRCLQRENRPLLPQERSDLARVRERIRCDWQTSYRNRHAALWRKVAGNLDKLDDFNVSLRDAQGEYRSFRRTSELKVEKNTTLPGRT